MTPGFGNNSGGAQPPLDGRALTILDSLVVQQTTFFTITVFHYAV
jgi:hypothetical protein